MKEMTLSDHTADQRNLAAEKRMGDYQAAYDKYMHAVANRKAKGEALSEASREKWRAKKYGAWLF